MDNITIGIVARDERIGKTTYQVVSQNILKYLDNKCNYIGLITHSKDYIDKELLEICDGIIIQGGSEISPYHYQIVNHCIKTKTPLLGICMGHQILGLYSNTKDEVSLIKVQNHNSENITHNINITPGTILHRLFGSNLTTNTRHNYALETVTKPFKVIAKSDDNVIEALEYTANGNYLLGVQWHPEDMNNMDNIFIDFTRAALLNKTNKNLS